MEDEFEIPEDELDDFKEPKRNKFDKIKQRFSKPKPKPEQKKEGALQQPPREVLEKESIKQETSIFGKYMFRDMPLFKYELLLYMGIMFVGIMLYGVERIGLIPNATRSIVIPATILPLGIWMLKWKLYMPSKKRVPHMHIYASRVIELGIVDISKGFLTLGKGEHLKRIFLTKVNKHAEASTGKPFIITSDLHGENLDLLEETKPDMRSEEFNAILDTNTAVTIKTTMNKMLKINVPTMSNPMFILALITLFGIAFLVIKSFGFFSGA